MSHFALFFALLSPFFHSSTSVTSYIEVYKDIAIVEMKRTGIPASIKLGQAILESSAGKSRLSLSSNNHFGIKCKSYWKGKTYDHIDDDVDRHGQLVPSCFRAYETVIDSYIDHSNFITNSVRYNSILVHQDQSYQHWATFLQKNGYATDPNYAKKLISCIEKYQLFEYDNL